jgi:exonuclease 3'-5' domain-containing protein 1
MVVIVIDDKAPGHATAQFLDAVNCAIEMAFRVAFDCEGIDLSRAGSVELVSLCFEGSSTEVFLVDLNEKTGKRHEHMQALKKLLECETVEKVIHDCRMDCDALYHLRGIAVKNVHDTSCFHTVITGMEDKNLNDVLSYNDIQQNLTRDKDVYKRNPAFWATRPLLPTMILWASADVDELLRVASRQVDRLSGSSSQMDRAMTKSEESTRYVRDMKLERGLQVHGRIGHFIGPRGQNLRSLQKRTGTMIYRESVPYWLVFYKDLAGLTAVKRAMGNSV